MSPSASPNVNESRLQVLQRTAKSDLPLILQNLERAECVRGEKTVPAKDAEELRKLFPRTFGQPLVTVQEGSPRKGKPLRVGVVFSGGPAAGGHNVIAGLFDGLKRLHAESRLFGFLGGPSGIIQAKFEELTETRLSPYRNQGGFDLIGSGRTKIETEEQLQASVKTMLDLGLDALVIIGGDDSNTNAAILAEYFLEKGCKTQIIGVPKTIDGDLKNAHVGISFGFDTACKVYSEIIGNLARDSFSTKKYTHFIRLMGRSASHIALECALSTHPNYTLIGEEIAAEKKTLSRVVQDLCDLIVKRAEMGKNYGIILIPEGVVEFIPEMKALIHELGQIPAADVPQKLSSEAKSCYESLPPSIQKQLLFDRDPHGNVQLSLIETERMLSEMVARELEKRSFKQQFSPLHHFLGYEGRSAFPSLFDSNYCYALGTCATVLINGGVSGYMCAIENLTKPLAAWKAAGVPLTMLLHLEKRKDKLKPVIQKALVDLKGKPFAAFKKQRDKWALDDAYCYPGPTQFFGDPELAFAVSQTLKLEKDEAL
jgi:pyrophosphate--fructose-6-phosphate 1-phosphotransferase